MENKEKYYSPNRPNNERDSNTYNTSKKDGVYCLMDEPQKSKQKKNRKTGFSQVLSALLIIVALVSIISLSWENRSLSRRLETSLLAQEQSQDYAKNALQPASQTNKHISIYSAAVNESQDREPLTITEIAKVGKPQVVAISTERPVMFGLYFEAMMPVSGSGFFISEDGYIATNNHVVEGARNIRVHTDAGMLYDAEIVGVDPASDLAVIKIEAHEDERFPVVNWGNSDALEVGELAVAIGNPSGTLEGSVTAGIISALERTIQVGDLELNVMQTDAAINAGNSGGALYNSFGEVIGINTAKLSGRGSSSFDGIAFAIPSNYAISILEELSVHGEVKSRVQLGIMGRGLDADFARRYNLADRPGILISSVLEGSSADEAGLMAGDFLVELDGRAADSIPAVNRMKKQWVIGEEIDVVYFRDGTRFSTTMILQGIDGETEFEPVPEETTNPEGEVKLPLDELFNCQANREDSLNLRARSINELRCPAKLRQERYN